ncbi:MAG: uncharacterized protein QG640_409 [Patescibacteria group bacterium]|nr:uncharacterized protein [Patescibacteria group bacterium]
MDEINNTASTAQILNAEAVKKEMLGFIHKVYLWMAAGLGVTALTSAVVVSSSSLLALIIGNKFVFIGLLIAQLLAVAYLSVAVKKFSALTAQVVFLLYSLLNGLTFSVIFLVYEFSSIAIVFLISAGMFACISIYGFVTKKDLTSVGNLCFMALIGIVIASLVNLFFMNDTAFFIIANLSVVIFVGLTAWDTQKIKMMNIIGNEGTEDDKKEAIMGALTLYLDFINLFLSLLRIFGKRRS